MKLSDAQPIAEQLRGLLAPHCERIEIAGSVRREEHAVKDIEIVVIPRPTLLPFMDELLKDGTVQKALYGEKQTTRWGDKHRGLMYEGARCEIFSAEPGNWGYVLWLRTGPADANKWMMQLLKRRDPTLKSIESWWHREHTRLDTPSEESVFALFGLPYIAPTDRTAQEYSRHMGAKPKAEQATTENIFSDQGEEPEEEPGKKKKKPRYWMLPKTSAQREAWERLPPDPEEGEWAHFAVYLWIKELQETIKDLREDLLDKHKKMGAHMRLNRLEPLLDAAKARYFHGIKVGLPDYRIVKKDQDEHEQSQSADGDVPRAVTGESSIAAD